MHSLWSSVTNQQRGYRRLDNSKLSFDKTENFVSTEFAMKRVQGMVYLNFAALPLLTFKI